MVVELVDDTEYDGVPEVVGKVLECINRRGTIEDVLSTSQLISGGLVDRLARDAVASPRSLRDRSSAPEHRELAASDPVQPLAARTPSGIVLRRVVERARERLRAQVGSDIRISGPPIEVAKDAVAVSLIERGERFGGVEPFVFRVGHTISLASELPRSWSRTMRDAS